MPQISNIGGSLTSAIVLTVLAWGVRILRATAQRSQGPSRKGSSAELGGTLPRFFSALTPAALRRLVRRSAGYCCACQCTSAEQRQHGTQSQDFDSSDQSHMDACHHQLLT